MFRLATNQISRNALLRTPVNAATRSRRYASSDAKGLPNAGNGSRKLPIFIVGAILFALVPGRYILASDKPSRSGHAAQQEARREGDPSQETRDPRDTGVKTLEQKKARDGK